MADKANYNKREIRYNQLKSDDKSSGKLFEISDKNKIADENSRWLNTNEAADFLRLTPNALRILVHRAQVRYFKFGHRLRFKVSDLHALLQSTEV